MLYVGINKVEISQSKEGFFKYFIQFGYIYKAVKEQNMLKHDEIFT